jgi:ribosomal protein S18 acetylase RimI-like enzyme
MESFLATASFAALWALTYVANCRALVAAQEQELLDDILKFPKPDDSSRIVVKPLMSIDCDAVIDIWLSGLKQTSMSFGALSRIRRKMHVGLKQYGERATAADGDMNPSAILAEWANSDILGKIMFVAHVGDLVVGLCGVARGCTQAGDDSDSAIPKNTFSLWRMSVSPAARRMGVGAKLCDAVEEFARKKGGERMRCVTANPLAARFYQSRGFVEVAPHPIAAWYEKAL